MKKLILLLLLLPLWSIAQTSTGQEQEFDYGIKNNAAQTVTSPTYLTTTGTDGTQGRSSNVVNQINSSNNSGILSGGALAVNADPTKFNIAEGVGYVMNSLTGVATKVIWATATAQTTPYLLTSVATYVLKDNAGATVLQNTAPTPAQYRTHIYIGKLAHTTFTTILFAVTEPSRMFDSTGQVADINKFLGSGNIEGNVITYNGANLNINASAGSTYRPGANYLNDRNSPSITTESSFTAGTFRNKFRNGSGGWSAVNTTTIDPNYYDDGTGLLALVPNNKWTIKVFWRFGGTGTIHCDYGQTVYDSKAQALEAVGKAVTSEDPETKRDASKRGWLVVKQGITVLNDNTTAEFLQADKFGERASGGSSTATMQTAYDNSVTPQIITSTGLGAVALKRGSAADTDNVLVVQNGAGTNTFSVTGAGNITGGTYNGYVPASLDSTGKLLTSEINNTDGNLGQLVSDNLADYTTYTSGKMVNWVTGVLQDNVDTKASEFIPVMEGLKYRYLCTSGFLGFIAGAWYDKDNNYISQMYNGGAVDDLFTAPTNARYARVSYPNSVGTNRDYFYQSFKLSSYGDSITAQNTWQPLLSKYLGAFSVVVGYGGAPLAGASSGALNQDTRLNTIPVDSDIVTVLAGTNDWVIGYPLGFENSTDVNEFYGALNSTFQKIKLRCPNARIVALCTTYGMYPNFFTNPIGISNNIGLTTADYGHAVEVAAKNNAVRFIRTDNLWSDKNISDFVTFDGAYLHPNTQGGKLIASKISLDMVQEVLDIRNKNAFNNFDGTINKIAKYDGFGHLIETNITDNGSLVSTSAPLTVGGLINSTGYHKITGSSPYTHYFMTGVSEWTSGLTDAGSGFYNFTADGTKVVSISGSGTLKSKNLIIETDPATSAGTYAFLTRNTSNGVVEKISTDIVLTGTPTAPTATTGTNTTQIATTAFVQNGLDTKIGGTLTSGYIPKATGANSLGNSLIYDNGTNVGIGTTSPSSIVHISSPGNTEQIIDAPSGTSILTMTSAVGGAGLIGYKNRLRIGTVTGYGAAGFTDLLNISTSGNVLINTDTDNGVDKLQVVGNAKFGSSSYGAHISTDGVLGWGASNNSGQLSWDTGKAIVRATSGNTLNLGANGSNEHLVINTNGSAKIASLSGTGTRMVTADASGNLSTTVGYKVYTALLTQSGTSAPTATVLDNTLGGTVVWTRSSTGIYVATLTGAFASNKTVCFTTKQFSGSVDTFYHASRNSADEVRVSTAISGGVSDGVLTGATIEIRVYN